MCQNINCKLCVCVFFSFCPLYFKCCMVVTYIKRKIIHKMLCMTAVYLWETTDIFFHFCT